MKHPDPIHSRRLWRFAWLPLVAALSLGCLYGHDIETQATPLTQFSSSVAPKAPPMHFGAEPSGEAYVEVALLEITGAESSSTRALMDEMQRRAVALGADAVINIHKGWHGREKGELITEIMSTFADKPKNRLEPERYEAAVLIGVAIVYRKNMVTVPPPSIGADAEPEPDPEPKRATKTKRKPKKTGTPFRSIPWDTGR